MRRENHDAETMSEDNVVPLARNETAPGDYRETTRGLEWLKHNADGSTEYRQITNFVAEIRESVTIDDGSGVSICRYLMKSRCEGIQRTFTIPAERFDSMAWTHEMSPRAHVVPGHLHRSRAGVAIRKLSRSVIRRVYAHTGWRTIDGVSVYLHAGGAIDANGERRDVHVDLDSALERFKLPAPSDEQAERLAAVRASWATTRLAPEICLPLLAAVTHAILGGARLSMYLAGPTGAGKSEIAALYQSHFGAGMARGHALPASWDSTANALLSMSFAAKDALLVVDDYIPRDTGDAASLNRKADRLLRAQGNCSGRARARPDGSLQVTRYPRGLILSTGEDIPAGHSLRARAVILEHRRHDEQAWWDQLTECQRAAASGQLAQSTAGLVRWIAESDLETIQEYARERSEEHRKRFAAISSHARTPDNLGGLLASLEIWIEYARSCGMFTANDDALESAAALFERVARAQGELLAEQKPAGMFLAAIRSALAAGAVHVAAGDERSPRWGWIDSHPRGERIGWLSEHELLLEPATAIRVAKLRDPRLALSNRTLLKQLAREGMIEVDTRDRDHERYRVRRRVAGRRHSVLALTPRGRVIIEGERCDDTTGEHSR